MPGRRLRPEAVCLLRTRVLNEDQSLYWDNKAIPIRMFRAALAYKDIFRYAEMISI